MSIRDNAKLDVLGILKAKTPLKLTEKSSGFVRGKFPTRLLAKSFSLRRRQHIDGILAKPRRNATQMGLTRRAPKT